MRVALVGFISVPPFKLEEAWRKRIYLYIVHICTDGGGGVLMVSVKRRNSLFRGPGHRREEQVDGKCFSSSQ